MRSNLGPLVEWVNAHPLPAPLDVLTNPESPGPVPSAAELGFRADRDVRVHEWTPERHRQFVVTARAALDVKGDEFRARHKPPAKALDFVASGLPLAMNPGTSSAEHLAALGLEVPSPLDPGTWLSERYAQGTRRLGERLTRELAPARVADRVRKLLVGVLRSRPARAPLPVAPAGLEQRYRAIQDRLARGEYADARPALEALDAADTPARLRAVVRNDLAALAALDGNRASAEAGFRAALELDPGCAPAAANLAALGAPAPARETEPGTPTPNHETGPAVLGPRSGPRAVRVAVLSVLFNWPSTGGGTVHSAELTKFLAAAGYEVRHLYARFEPWGLGKVTAPTPFPAEPLEFTGAEWTTEGLVTRFRAAVDAFDPDWVVLTDSWNLKPVLARAAGGRPYVLRLQALECLCPLNNVRLLPGPGGEPRQCTRHQLATPDACARCVRELGHTSGDLHRAERALAGVGTPGYRAELFAAFEGAAAVLAVNPLTAAMVEPHARDVRVVTAGMDPDRFPWPFPNERRAGATPGRLRVLFAGLTREWMKGFHVLRAAATRLWEARRDFEVVVTDAAPDGPVEPWARYIGWQSQGDLPGHLAGADVVVVPTVAQEALGRTAVEAMAAGKPVVASRIGGLPFTVTDGATGALCAPGDPVELAGTLARLLGDAPLRARLGAAGRARFEEHFAWPAIVARHYRPLFGEPVPVSDPVPHVVEPPGPVAPAPQPLVGCVLAVRDRPAGVLERTLQTYQWQTAPAADRVLVDYGSEPAHAREYEKLCARYGWRLVRCEPPEPRWHLADAYNRAVAALDPRVEVLFKSDTDVLLGPEVLGVAARRGPARSASSGT
ncbi:D-inositol 3-phosphate glycosyltransferase [Gemmata sp. SH-PL17]|nr:D-inositol 3-phosphate glycosyltransferase [Gemmata sp. SH-PL17]